MALQDYYAGWDYARIGSGTLTVTVTSPGAHADVVTWNTGTYSHFDLSAVTGASTYVSWATTLQTYLNSLGGTRPTYTVTFSQTTMLYTISVSAGTVQLTFGGTSAGTVAKRILGFSATTGAAASQTSDVRPYYAIRAVCGGPSAFSFYYENSAGIAYDEADDGTDYSISRRTITKYLDWEQHLENRTAPAVASAASAEGAGVRIPDATSQVPWTWEHFFQHVRCVEPFTLHNSTGPTGYVCKLRGEGAYFKPTIVVPDYATLWNIPIKSRYLGTY